MQTTDERNARRRQLYAEKREHMKALRRVRDNRYRAWLKLREGLRQLARAIALTASAWLRHRTQYVPMASPYRLSPPVLLEHAEATLRNYTHPLNIPTPPGWAHHL